MITNPDLAASRAEMDRRSFLRRSGAFACGFAATALSVPLVAGADAQPYSPDERPNIFGPREGYSPQVGTLVSMLNWMRTAILQPVKGLTVAQLDHLHDAKANSIGA